MVFDGAGIDHSKFGLGYQTEAQRLGKYVLADDAVRYDATSGAGGAVPVRNYDGVWPPWKDQVSRQQQEVQEQKHGDKGVKDASMAKGGESSLSSIKDAVGSSSASVKRPDWMCRTIKQCSPCDKREMHYPYCQPYGNKITIECHQIDVLPTNQNVDKLPGHAKPAKLPPGKMAGTGKGASAGDSHAGEKEAAAERQGQRRRNLASWARTTTLEDGNNLRDVDDGIEWYSLDGLLDTHDRPLFMVEPSSSSQDGGPRRRQLLRRSVKGTQNTDGPSLGARQETYVSSFAFKGYQVCGRSRAKEAGDYAEFVGINLLLSLAALYVLLQRQRDLARRHQAMVARRIGRT